MDRNEMLNWLVENVKQWPQPHWLENRMPALPSKSWGWVCSPGSWRVVAQGWVPILKGNVEAARAEHRDLTRGAVLTALRGTFQDWPTEMPGRLEFRPGWSWSVDEHGFMKLGDITYLDFYQAKGLPLPRDLMIKHLKAHLNEWPTEGSKVASFARAGTQWYWHHQAGCGMSLRTKTGDAIFAQDVKLHEGGLASLAELLQCKPHEVLDVVRNLVPDWHTVPAHVDMLQVVWSHAQGHKQAKRVFLERPKAPVDQETVDDLLARFDKDSLQEAFSK